MTHSSGPWKYQPQKNNKGRIRRVLAMAAIVAAIFVALHVTDPLSITHASECATEAC